MMKVTLRISSLLFVLICLSTTVWAQPSNNNCGTATQLAVASSEATVVLLPGDTRGATASPPANYCFVNDHDDDVWYRITVPADVTDEGIVVRTYFNRNDTPTDILAVGMAIYESCGATAVATHCFTTGNGSIDQFTVSGICNQAGDVIYLRVWSTGSTAASQGTFRVGVYNAPPPEDIILWNETFADGLGDWTTLGTCSNPDSNINGGWKYYPDGIIDQGAYAFTGYRVSGPTWCNGAMGYDSDYADNLGVQGNFGAGPCPAPPQGSFNQQILTSPVIDISDWDVAGITLTFYQALRNFVSDYIISYRTKNAGGDWTAWTEKAINPEVDFPINARYEAFNKQRVALIGTAGADSLQFRFIYNDNYYFWIVDDISLVETECTNTVAGEANFFAVSPWTSVPIGQTYDYPVLADIKNIGACTQTNVVLNHTVVDSNGNVVYDTDLTYGSLIQDSLAENKPFPDLVSIPDVGSVYTGTYFVSQDLPDFDSSDNVVSYQFNVGGKVFALETGATTSITPADANWEVGAPPSYTYGNYFYPVKDVTVDSITWGISNTAAMANQSVNIHLFQWTDANGDQVVQDLERRFVGSTQYTFTGGEVASGHINSVLENLNNPFAPVVMEGGFGYIVMIEYQAFAGTDPKMFLLVSQERDYSATNLAFDQAFDAGLVDHRFYASILGIAADGNLSEIDYSTVGFGFDYVPVVRINADIMVNTEDQLPTDNKVSIYPNPASEDIKVKLEFAKPYDDVQLRLINNLGQQVMIKTLTNTITTHVESLSIRDLPSGNYLLQVETTDGQRSIPVIIVK